MNLIVHATWHGADKTVWLTAILDRPYGREPMVGELLTIGDDEDNQWTEEVQQVEWTPDGCHLDLGSVHESPTETLEWLESLGFKQ